jgi:hypothetical protein
MRKIAAGDEESHENERASATFWNKPVMPLIPDQ